MKLLTPGPLTTADATRTALTRDWGSRDDEFVELTASVRRDLLAIASRSDRYACVPMQGSGTFAVEATIGSLVPRDGKVLVPHNGSYGARLAEICVRIGRACSAVASAELEPLEAGAIDRALAADPAITHVAVVHVETGAGMTNPIAAIAEVCRARGRRLIIDAMSSFGALALDADALGCDAIVAASGKCLEGVPGLGFAIARRDVLAAAGAAGNAHSLALDLAAQAQGFDANGQWRFTPPTQVVAGLRAALDAFAAEGGQPARLARYRRNCATLVDGMAALGVAPVLRRELQAPIIVSFPWPRGADFARFYARVRGEGFIVYPGKLVGMETFRVGCIGAIDHEDLERAVAAIGRAR